MAYYCPKCDRVLYSRRLILCGFCGAEIPESLRLTPEKISQQDQELAEMEAAAQQRRDRAAGEEKARREKARRSTGNDDSF
jgi:DNA-directed RNA polymerase subunit M/transcription elongation factor TFIIS